MKKILYLFIAAATLCSCEKELSLEGGLVTQPEPKPEPADTTRKFQLTAFYSDIPIDFDDTDGEVKMETNLWDYVYDYIKDDFHILRTDTTMEILQNSVKKPGLEDPILYRSYAIGTDDLGEFMIYLTAGYGQEKYRLIEMTDDYFVISLKWKDGARVFSRFDRIK